MVRRPILLVFLVVLGSLTLAPTCGGGQGPPVGPNATSVVLGNFTLTYTLVSSRRISRTQFEYTYTADLTNNGVNIATGATASVASQNAATVVTDGSLSFGNVNAGQTVASTDTFTILHDRSIPFSPSNLAFQVMAGTGGGTPTPPTGLGALSGNGRALLRWDADPNPQAGYHVYESPTPNILASFQRVNPTLLQQPRFTDTSLTNGIDAFFVVTTVVGNSESAFSSPVGVQPPSFQTMRLPHSGADLRLSSRLADLKRLLADGDSPASAAGAMGITLGRSGELLLRGHADGGSAPGIVGALQGIGAQSVTTDGAIAHFGLAPALLGSLVASVPISSVAVEPEPQTNQALPSRNRSEGSRTIGADDMRARGITGKNVRIAVKDAGFNYTGNGLDQLTRPNLPGTPPVVTRRFCPNGNHNAVCPSAFSADRFEMPNSGGNHGDAVVEVINDTAPDVEMHLYAPVSPQESLGAYTDAVAQGTQVGTSSIGFPFPEDDVDATSSRIMAENSLAANQIVLAQAAGNEGRYLNAVDTFVPDSNGYHTWNSSKYPTAVTCDVADPSMAIPSVRASCLPVRWNSTTNTAIYLSYNQWPLASTDDLDLYFLTSSNGPLNANNVPEPAQNVCACGSQPVAPATATALPVEQLQMTWGGTNGFLVVHRKATSNAASRPRFRVYGFRDLANASGTFPAGAIPSSIHLTDAAATNILAVGATRWDTDRVETYSSRGPVVDPTTGGLTRAKPDIAGPACNSSGPLSPIFCGTSASTPHVAAATALMIEWCGLVPCTDTNGVAVDPATPADLRRLMLDKAIDLSHVPIAHGPNDIPNAWGAGRVDVTPPIVFRGSDGVFYRRDVTSTADATDGLTMLPFVGEHPAVSPDGTKLAFMSRVGSSFEIFVADLYDFTTQPLQITFGGTTRAAFHPAWSPDGTQIAYVERNRYMVGGNLALAFTLDIAHADGSGKDHRVVTFTATTGDNHGVAFPDWDPSGDIAFTLMTPQPGSNGVRYSNYEIAVVPATGSGLRFPDPSIQVLTPGIRPRWGRAGSFIAYMTLNDPNQDLLPFPLSFTLNPTIRLFELVSASPLPGGFSGADPTWSPSGSRLVFTRNPTEGQAVDPRNFHLFQGWIDPLMGPTLPFVGLVDELQLTNTITLGRVAGMSVPGQNSPSW